MSTECQPTQQVSDLEQFDSSTRVTSPVQMPHLSEQEVKSQGKQILAVQSLELASEVVSTESSLQDGLLDQKPIVLPVYRGNSNLFRRQQNLVESSEAAVGGSTQSQNIREGQLRELLVMGLSEVYAKEADVSNVNLNLEHFSVAADNIIQAHSVIAAHNSMSTHDVPTHSSIPTHSTVPAHSTIPTHSTISSSVYCAEEDYAGPIDLHAEGSMTVVPIVEIKQEQSELPRPKKIRHKKRVNGKNVCLVCGDKALAHNFGVITCESCKAFFRRNALKPQSVQKCMFHNRCIIDKNTRRFCPSCRLKKCFDIGMKADLILDEEERRLRQEKKNLRIKRQAASSSTLVDGDSASDVQVVSSGRPAAPGESSDNSCTHSPDSVGAVAYSPASRNPASLTSQQTSPLPSIHTLRDSVGSPPTPLRQVSPMYSQNSPYGIVSPGAAGLSSSADQSPLKGFLVEWTSTLPSMASSGQALVSSSIGQTSLQSPLHFDRKVLSKALSTTTNTTISNGSPPGAEQTAAHASQDSPESQDEKRMDESPFPLPGPAARLFRHVALDQLPSDPFMYWLVSAEERLVLASLTTAYQDVLLTLSERGLYRSVPLCDTYFLHDFLNEIDDAMYRIVQFSKHIPDFRAVGKEDQIAMLKASAMQTLGIACCAVYVHERDCWLSLRGDLTLSHLRRLTNDDPYIQAGVEYCRSVKSLAKNDFTIYALIHCMILFDPRVAKIVDRQLVNQTRDKYVIMLKHYLEARYSYLFADEYFVAIQERVREMCHLAQRGNVFYKRYSSAFQPLIAEMLSAT